MMKSILDRKYEKKKAILTHSQRTTEEAKSSAEQSLRLLSSAITKLMGVNDDEHTPQEEQAKVLLRKALRHTQRAIRYLDIR